MGPPFPPLPQGGRGEGGRVDRPIIILELNFSCKKEGGRQRERENETKRKLKRRAKGRKSEGQDEEDRRKK